MRFLTDPADIDAHRAEITRLLSPVADQAARGEFTVEDIIDYAKEGRMVIGLMSQPEMCGAFEFRHYPQTMSVNIVALGGRDLQTFSGAVLDKFCAWAAGVGASTIEASCSEGMARMLRRSGFEKEYEVVRLSIQGAAC